MQQNVIHRAKWRKTNDCHGCFEHKLKHTHDHMYTCIVHDKQNIHEYSDDSTLGMWLGFPTFDIFCRTRLFFYSSQLVFYPFTLAQGFVRLECGCIYSFGFYALPWLFQNAFSAASFMIARFSHSIL